MHTKLGHRDLFCILFFCSLCNKKQKPFAPILTPKNCICSFTLTKQSVILTKGDNCIEDRIINAFHFLFALKMLYLYWVNKYIWGKLQISTIFFLQRRDWGINCLDSVWIGLLRLTWILFLNKYRLNSM